MLLSVQNQDILSIMPFGMCNCFSGERWQLKYKQNQLTKVLLCPPHMYFHSYMMFLHAVYIVCMPTIAKLWETSMATT